MEKLNGKCICRSAPNLSADQCGGESSMHLRGFVSFGDLCRIRHVVFRFYAKVLLHSSVKAMCGDIEWRLANGEWQVASGVRRV
ncbi:unnamed protein product [Ceratitis capitata]|uniref:(Mediterranean fruit fly) hypothetical protein n=1 Tax=Ceratitis capitata TaxID=7213 RepID=A0A811VDH5_CERCA|nr:unnamed protein product [Ceratitis capitata]